MSVWTSGWAMRLSKQLRLWSPIHPTRIPHETGALVTVRFCIGQVSNYRTNVQRLYGATTITTGVNIVAIKPEIIWKIKWNRITDHIRVSNVAKSKCSHDSTWSELEFKYDKSMNVMNGNSQKMIRSLGPSDAIWRWKTWSTLVQVLACCQFDQSGDQWNLIKRWHC